VYIGLPITTPARSKSCLWPRPPVFKISFVIGSAAHESYVFQLASVRMTVIPTNVKSRVQSREGL
jgi:hypothetical protein